MDILDVHVILTILILSLFIAGMTAYGYAFYCLLARDDRGHGTPLAYTILSSDTSSSLATALRHLVSNAEQSNITFSPR